MPDTKHTPGPWFVDDDGEKVVVRGKDHGRVCHLTWLRGPHGFHGRRTDEEVGANAVLIAAATDMLEALRLHQAWSDSERSGPDYGVQTRDTHPDGEMIWRRWWDNQLDLCDRAQEATRAAIARVESRNA